MRSEGGVSGPFVSIAILPSSSDTAMTKVHLGQGSDLAEGEVSQMRKRVNRPTTQ